jgi:hypothetical protein
MIKHFLVTIDDTTPNQNIDKHTIRTLIKDPDGEYPPIPGLSICSIESMDIIDHNKYPSDSCSCPHHIGYSAGPNGQVLCNRCGKPNPTPS